MKVAIILGTRPQIIKSAPVFKAFKKTDIECSVINTGQHYDYEMNRSFFVELSLPEPEIDLGIGAGTANEQISKIIAGLEAHFEKSEPDLAIVPGDTNSALAAGIASSKSQVPIAHLESGCRSNDLRMSEEVNRRVLDHISRVLLCPTATCAQNLRAERVLAEVIETVGDTMYDSILQCSGSIAKSDATKRHSVKEGAYAFMTLHRAENVDDREILASMLSAVGSFDTPVLFSVHPRTRARMNQFNVREPANVTLIEPLAYFDALRIVRDSRFVITDSGGLQKEAFWLGKPTLVARDVTEWMEIVQAGGAFLVGTDRRRMADGYKWVQELDHNLLDRLPRIFGDGNASQKVVDVITAYVSSH
jgi:UDP-N-acetylglucosamine 2-epimerase